MKKPIYIKRTLILSDAFLLWCKTAGFETRLPKDDLHVTLAYSNDKVDVSKVELKNDVFMDVSTDRELEQFGDAVVFIFRNKDLHKRWQEFIDLGCSWGHDDYTPHVTITYNKPPGLDITKLEPFKGQLIFSNEILEDLNVNKSDEYKEVNIKKNVLEW